MDLDGAAVEHVVALLECHGRGLCAAEVVANRWALGEPHARWTPEMCLSALGTDARLLRGGASEAIGLYAWGEPRVPTRRDLLTELLDQGGGRARDAAVLQRIEAVYRRPLPRWALPVLAGHCGAAGVGARDTQVGVRGDCPPIGEWALRYPGPGTLREDVGTGVYVLEARGGDRGL